jgi:beta-ureidopropionase
MKTELISRRNFVRNTALTTGFASLAPAALIAGDASEIRSGNEVWIAGISQNGLRAKTADLMCERVLGILKDVVAYQPDFVCLPEIFPFTYIDQKLTLAEQVEISEKVLEQFADFSRQNNCYTVCPVYTKVNGAVYNSAVVFDRSGKRIGQYNKIHPTDGEIEPGISPGALFQPVIQTDFGPVGVQICFDINWDDGWKMLREQGARIIFWPSAYGGGMTVNTRAWRHKTIVATSTNKHTSKLCDLTGETITQTGYWNQNLYCGPVNLEKVFLASWPNVYRFKDVQNKYGRKVRITTFHEEEWSIIESLSPELHVNDILKEFEFKTYEEHIASSEIIQDKARK